MEVFPPANTNTKANSNPPPEADAPSTRSGSRRSSSSPSRSSATPRSQSQSTSTALTTPELPKLPALSRPRLLAEIPKAPSHDGSTASALPEKVHDAVFRQTQPKGTRPPLTRHHTTEALRARPPPSHSTFYSPALGSANIVPRRTSPPRHSTTERNDQDSRPCPPPGDSRKRAASLDDLSLSLRPRPTSASMSPATLNLPSSPLPRNVAYNAQHSEPPSGTTGSRAHGARRWHALMELISTEEGYVKDLKILVRVYLEHLSSVVTLEHDARRQIARNADALLSLHKKICRRMQRVINEERIRDLALDKTSKEAERRVERAVGRVAAIFIKEAASFHLYEIFCAGHSHALELIRQVQALPEWDMYEKRCSVIVADEQAKFETLKSPAPAAATTPIIQTPIVRSPSSPVIHHPRRHSTDVAPKITVVLPTSSKLTMKDFLIKPVQRICRYPLLLGQMQSPTPTQAQGHAESGAGFTSSRSLQSSDSHSAHNRSGSWLGSEASFQIGRDEGSTKVPPGASAGSDKVEAQALEAMKLVAAKVDEARRKTDGEIKSRLVVERVPEQTLPQLALLGSCLLAGSLDVVYHHENIAPITTPIKVRYLGTFLYGGWMMFVKVLKNKVYEPRHWFPLLDASLTDILEDDALLPCSFRLSIGDHHFELAAACAQEKAVWLNHIRQACAQGPPNVNPLPSNLGEPVTKPTTPNSRAPSKKSTGSTQLPPSGGVFPIVMSPTSGDTVVAPPKRDSSLGAVEGIPTHIAHPSLGKLVTIQGMPEDKDLPMSPTSVADSSDPRTSTPSNTTPTPSRGPVLNTSDPIKSLLKGEASTILIRRSSTNHRKMVDSSLQDVFFEECQSVRIAAQMKEPLFQPPKLTADSGSLVARNKMTRRDSVLLRRQRSVADTTSSHTGQSPARNNSTSKFALVRNKSAGAIESAKELRRRTLMIPSFSFFAEREEDRTSNGQRPGTADGTSLPGTPDENSLGDQLTFQPKRQKWRRASGIVDMSAEKQLPDRPPRPITMHGTPPATLELLKELPPTPDSGAHRRSTTVADPAPKRNSRPFSTLPTRRPLEEVNTEEGQGRVVVQVLPAGEGLSNHDPVTAPNTNRKSWLHPDSLIRKSMNMFSSKRNRNTTGSYIAGLFNRSAVSVVPEPNADALRSQSEPPPVPTNRLSASTPTLKEGLSNWEILPSVSVLKHSDMKTTKPSTSQSSCSTDLPSPFTSLAPVAVPPTPSRPMPQPLRSSLRRKGSQIIQHFNLLSSQPSS